MKREDLMLAVMNDIPELDEPEQVLFAFNRIIGQMNTVIMGVRDLVVAVSEGTAETGWQWEGRTLKLKGNIKEVMNVYVDGERWEHRVLSEVEAFKRHKVYAAIANNQLQFAADTTISGDIKLAVLRGFDKVDVNDIDSEVDIELPEYWEEGIISGIVAQLSVSKYKDEARHKYNNEIYRTMLAGINQWENSKFPPAGEQVYNYQKIARSMRTL